MLPLPGLSPVCGKTIVAKFDGGVLSSDGGGTDFTASRPPRQAAGDSESGQEPTFAAPQSMKGAATVIYRRAHQIVH
jgi:hypothetical protein